MGTIESEVANTTLINFSITTDDMMILIVTSDVRFEHLSRVKS